jgi:hypothetical protein
MVHNPPAAFIVEHGFLRRGPIEAALRGLATQPDDQRKDDCSRQNASQDNLNKRKVDQTQK